MSSKVALRIPDRCLHRSRDRMIPPSIRSSDTLVPGIDGVRVETSGREREPGSPPTNGTSGGQVFSYGAHYARGFRHLLQARMKSA